MERTRIFAKWENGIDNIVGSASTQDRASVNKGESLSGKLTSNLTKVIESRETTTALIYKINHKYIDAHKCVNNAFFIRKYY